MTTFPRNPATSLKLMDIAIDLEGINHQSLFAETIISSVRAGHVIQAVKEIYEQTLDNRPLVCDIVGYRTVEKIEKLFQ